MKNNLRITPKLGRILTLSQVGQAAPNHAAVRYITRLISIIVFLVLPVSSIAQLPFSEDFSTSAYRDDSPGQTTADWNTNLQQLNLPLSPTLVGITFDETSVVEVIPGRYNTRAVGLADLNGDGSLDLIDGVFGNNGVHLNRGDGTFGVRSYTSPRSRNTRSIAVGDVDRDGDIDFVTANFTRPIQLHLNDGTGTNFDIQNVSSNGRRTNDVALADINGDGFLDVVAANLGFLSNKLFLNTADPLVPFGVGGTNGIDLGSNPLESSRHVSVGDLDEDGDVDIVFMNEDALTPRDGYREKRNRVLMNGLAQGAPNTFSSSEIAIEGLNDSRFSVEGALGDMNADGFLDLIVCNRNAGQASQIYFNNGAAAINANPFTTAAVDFTGTVSPNVPIPCASVATADADNDGDLDIFVTGSGNEFRNRIYFNEGTGSAYVSVDVGPSGQAPLVLSDPSHIGADSEAGAVGDIDNDGDIDWVIGNQAFIGSSSPLENNLFRNSGSDGLTLAQQLTAKATSVQIDNSGTTSVRLSPSPSTGVVGPEYLNQVDYWVSGDGGQSWASLLPDGRPVTIGVGNDIRWRAVLRSESPAMAPGLALFQLDIAENQTGPVLVTPIGSAEVNEDDSATGLPIVSSFADPDGDTIYYSIIGLPAGSGLAIDPLTGVIDGTPTNDDAVASPITATVFATDGALTATDTFTLVVINENDSPVITSLPPTANATQDAFYSHTVVAEDPDPNESALLTFSVSSAPAWLMLTDNLDGTATLSGTPGNSDVTGDNSVVVVASDPSGLTDTQSFQIIVDNVNDQPIFVSDPPVTAVQGAAYSYNIVTSDPDDGETMQLTISTTSKPTWLTLVDNGDGTATLSGTPGNSDVTGDNSVVVVASDPSGLTDTQSFQIIVDNVNDQPIFVSDPPVTAVQGAAYSYNIVTSDPDDGETMQLTISTTSKPTWLTLVDNGDGTATLSGTPGNSDVTGDNSVVVVASDPSGLTDTQSFQIIVDNVNDQPIFVSDPPVTAVQGAAYSYNIVTSDPDDGETMQLTISTTSKPTWLTLVDNGDGTATLTGTPSNADVAAQNTVTLVVSDPGGLNDTQNFVISVANINDAPVFQSVPQTNATQDVPYVYLISATDADIGDTGSLTISAVSIPAWLTLASSGGGTATLSGTPSAADVDADNTVSLLVFDQSGLTDTQEFVIAVENRNDRPIFTSVPPNGDVLTGNTFTYNVSALDPDAGETAELVFSAPTLPQWLTLSDLGDGTAVLSGIPDAGDVAGNNSVELVVVDPAGLSSTQSFVVNIRSTNIAPDFASTPTYNATESSEYSYSIRAIDPNSDAVTITAPTLPAWLSLTDHGNGFAILRGAPRGIDVGDHEVVLQAEEDNPAEGLVTLQQFVITVTASGDGPTIAVNGDSEMNIFEGWIFNDPGATASDVEDGDLSQQIVVDGYVSTSAPGVYILTYVVSDSAGNRAQAQRIVRVVSPPEEGGIGSSGPAGLLMLFLIALLGRSIGRAKPGL